MVEQVVESTRYCDKRWNVVTSADRHVVHRRAYFHNAVMISLDRYLRHERLYVGLLLAGYLLINNSINATSIIMEAPRAGASVPISQPLITEYSSALALLILFPAVLWFANRFPIHWGELRRNALAHLGFSVVFSIAHIALFVALRKFCFGLKDVDYTFSDNLLLSFIYEYRKDAWGYVFLIICIQSYRFILSRLRGEATPVSSSEDAPPEKAPERFLIRKLGKEFVVRVDDVEWLEAAGNYVNLHIGERVYPLRATMATLVESLAERGFVRIHRSRGVNLNYVESISPMDSGDCTVSLKSGQTIDLSRRYREAFRQHLNQHMGTGRPA